MTGTLRILLIDFLRGTSILKVLKEFRQQQYLPKAEIAAINRKNLDTLFATAKLSAKYYQPYNNYEELPVLTKDMVRAYLSELTNTNFKGKLTRKGTGGSTGTPLVYYTTAKAQSYMWAGILLSWEVAGYKLGDKVAFVAGTSLFKSDFKHQVFHKLMNIDSYSAFSLNDENIQQYINSIKKSKAKIIYCYPNAIDIIANYIQKNVPEFTFPDLRGIVSTSEMLTDAVRENVEKTFKVKVYNQYGCNEAGVSAFECEHRTMHLIDARSKYDFDANGNLLSTDLANEGFIMMKYLTGDVVEFSPENNCDCKRNFTTIKTIIGRTNDNIKDMNNNIIHSAFFNLLLRGDETVKQYQILYNKESITVHLNIEEGVYPPDHYNKYMDIVKKNLTFNEYKLILNAPFLKTDNAKHRFVIDTSH